MYVTRPLSLYRRDPSALSLPPPDGPNSGVLVIQDEEAQPTCCFGICKSNQIKDMPFPQNKNLDAWHSMSIGQVDFSVHYPVVFIPVINQPLSSNRYYVIQQRGDHEGKAHLISMEEGNKTKCAYCGSISDKKPEHSDLNGRYRQFEICKKRDRFRMKSSSAADANDPSFSKRGFWYVETSSKHEFLLHEAPGLDAKLRDRLPEFNFPLSETSSADVVVGKWYSPFIFIQEGSWKDQMNNSRYYEITLDQRWEKIFESENTNNAGNFVTVDVAVDSKVATVAGNEVSTDRRNVVDGFMWFRSTSKVGGESSVGLSLAVWDRMKYEQQRFGCIGGSGAKKKVKVKRVEEFGGNGDWRKLGFYALVERFVIKRADGRLVMSYEFKHTNQIRTKWE